MRLNRTFVVGLVAAGVVGMAGTSSVVEAAPVFPACQIWTTSQGGNYPTLIDSHTSQVSTLDIGDRSWNVTMTSDGSKAYVATDNSGIKVIDIASNYQLSTINQGSYVVATSPLGDRLYSTDWNPGVVYEYDTATDSATGRSATTSANPIDMVVSPDGRFIYVANFNTSPETVTRIATANFTATQHVVGPGVANAGLLAGLAISPDGETLYAAQNTASKVIEIDTSNMTAVRTVSVPLNPRGIAIDSTGSTIYVAAEGSNQTVAIDTATLQVTATINVGTSPTDLVIAPDDSQLFVANAASNTVSRIDLATHTVIETINVASAPSGIAIGPTNCTVTPQPAPTPAPSIPIWRVSMDPAGGVCADGVATHDDEWTSVFVGYRYLPGGSDCEREGYSFAGWADVDDPETPLTLPLLVDPSDGTKRWFVAADHSVVAVWAKVEEAPELPEDLSGTAPGAFVGGPDRATAEGGGVVDGYYIPPRVEFGPWMVATPR